MLAFGLTVALEEFLYMWKHWSVQHGNAGHLWPKHNVHAFLWPTFPCTSVIYDPKTNTHKQQGSLCVIFHSDLCQLYLAGQTVREKENPAAKLRVVPVVYTEKWSTQQQNVLEVKTAVVTSLEICARQRNYITAIVVALWCCTANVGLMQTSAC